MTHGPERLDALTGLRFVAAAAVSLSHLQLWLHLDEWNLGTLGSSGVGFFFVLSGFILAHVYRSGNRSLEPVPFYMARFARIWPVHATCLFLMIGANGVGPSKEPVTATHRIVEHALLLQSWTTDIHWAHSLNGPAWSLSVEAFFYALFPLLANLGMRRLLALLGTCWLVNATVYWLLDGSAADPAMRSVWECVAVTAPPLRLQEFVLGICAHAWWSRKNAPAPSANSTLLATAAEVLACGLVFACFRALTPCGLGPAWIDAPGHEASLIAMARGPGLSVAFAALVATFADGRGLLGKLCKSAPMAHLGEISYAFYLVHTFVLLMTTRRFESHGIELDWTTQALAATCMSIGAATLLHAFIEVPLRISILARGAALSARLRIAWSSAAAACRRPWCIASTAVGALGIATATLNAPGIADLGRLLAERGSPQLHNVDFGPSCTLAGAVTAPEPPRFRAWISLMEAPGSAHSAVLEARTKDGALVHTFANTVRQEQSADGTMWTLITIGAELPQLLGASVLTMTIRDGNDAEARPNSGPTTSDGRSLELLRLPW